MSKKIAFASAVLAFFLFAGAGCITRDSSALGIKGIFRSLDKGEKWEAAAALPTADGVGNISAIDVYRLFDDPSDPDAYYLGTRDQGLFFTYDNARSWQMVDDLYIKNKFIYGLAVNPKDKCEIYVTDGSHIYKSWDCTRTWGLIFTEERVEQKFVALAVDDFSGKVYGLQSGGDLLMSADEGKSWQVIKRFEVSVKDMVLDSRTPGRLFVATEGRGLFRSDTAGLEWVNMNEELAKFENSKQFFRLALNPAQADSLFWISKYGILRSDDAGATWTDLKLLTPPGSVSIFGFAVNPQNQNELYYTATILDDKNQPVKSTFYKSADGGQSWVTKKLPTGTIPVVIKVHPRDEKMIFMGFTLLSK